jgi:hypothetical protein
MPSNDSKSTHRVVLTFDNGLVAKLICPPGDSCVGSKVCVMCGREVRDPESTPCYDCRDMNPDECWVKTWFDNVSPEELLHGTVEVEIDATWDGDHMIARIVEPPAAAHPRWRGELVPVNSARTAPAAAIREGASVSGHASEPQHAVALRHANSVRVGEHALLREVAAHDLSIPGALDDPRAAGIEIGVLLLRQHGWGPQRVSETLRAAGQLLWRHGESPLRGNATVEELTPRMRNALLEALQQGRRDAA